MFNDTTSHPTTIHFSKNTAESLAPLFSFHNLVLKFLVGKV